MRVGKATAGRRLTGAKAGVLDDMRRVGNRIGNKAMPVVKAYGPAVAALALGAGAAHLGHGALMAKGANRALKSGDPAKMARVASRLANQYPKGKGMTHLYNPNFAGQPDIL